MARRDWQFSKNGLVVTTDECGNIRFTRSTDMSSITLSISEVVWVQAVLDAMDKPTSPPVFHEQQP